MFEPYVCESHGRGRGGKDTLTVRPNGTIGLGKRLVEQQGLAGKTDVLLFYDKDNNQIGMKVLNEPEYGSTVIRCAGKSPHWTINHAGFAKHHEIEPGDYQFLENTGNGLYVFGRDDKATIQATSRYAVIAIPQEKDDNEVNEALDLVGGKQV